MKIYLAARFSRHPEMEVYARDLRNMGHDVTSRWHAEGDAHTIAKGIEGPEADALRTRFASEDVADLLQSQCVILFTQPLREMTDERGGRHVEFGMVLWTGRRCILVGNRENVFHYLPQVEQHDTWELAKDAIRNA